MKKVIGIDVGGTGVKGSVITETGEVLTSQRIATDVSKGREGILSCIYSVIDRLLSADIVAIGIGSAGRINVHTGEVVYATANLPGWQGVNLKQELEKSYQLPVVVENDANAALLGELWQGAVANDDTLTSVTMLTLGTGVGGANSLHKQIINGGHYQGGEWGHVIFIPNGRPCNCGMKGCLEQYLSGTALVTMTNKATNRTYLHGKEIFEEYASGDLQLAPIIDTYIDHLALAIYNVSITFDPTAVIIGGGVIDSKEIWWQLLLDKLVNYHVHLQVFPAELGNDAGMLGAAKLAFDHVKEGGN
ncbi:ROK family protein [Anaerobacillus alkaliphilus]|uniref:ROK family protein n=1 Tax=Anaerobacillus alkaliphilus TaxID=1548597 RepID=A0A4Q0VU25_9BACI|nr:ROK family protein [Anaerobacillus alkaliphilus]RXJ02181.1 ROK family protein [Anaerobacillus alkaliphilus]